MDGSTSGGRRHYYRSTARIAWQTAEALAYAHERGVIHRDIKPSNLILDASGVAWVTDFGLAKTDDEGMTQTGDFLGTLRYMSPERFQGICDERADVYALGLTLYELIALRPAFKGADRLRLIEAIGREDPQSLRSIDRRVPSDLETIVLKAIEKEPKARYGSAKELARDLQRFLDDVPIRARRTSIGERLLRWSRRNKALAGAVVGIFALVMALAMVSTVAWVRQSQLTVVAEQRADELQRNLYYSVMNVASQSASSNFGVPTIRRQLQRWRPENVGVDLRGWEWYFLHAMSHRERLTTPRLDVWTWSVDFNPSADEFVHCVNAWGIQVRSAATGELLREKMLGSARYVDWSPDGTRIAVAGFNANVNVCDARTLEVIVELGGKRAQEVYCVKWNPAGDLLATCRRPLDGNTSAIRIWNANTGDLVHEFDSADQNPTGLSWSPDGSRLVSAGIGSLSVWDAATGRELHRTPEHVNTSCWSPDGKSYVIGHDRIEIKDVASGNTTHLIRGNMNLDIQSIGWRPNSQQIACGHADGTITLWNIESKTRLRTFHGHTSAVSDLKWDQDGTQIVSNGMHNTVRVWDVDGYDQTQVIPFNSDAIDWSDDGTWLAGSAVWGADVAVCDVREAQIEEILTDAHQPTAISIAGGHKVAIAGRLGLKIWDKNTKRFLLDDKAYWYGDVDWSCDGQRLAAPDQFQPLLMIWDADTLQRQEIDTEEQPRAVRWSPNGTRLAIASRSGGVAMRDASGALVWHTIREGATHAICWSPDGSRLASTENGAVVVWDATSGKILRVLDALSEDFGSIDWNPNGRRIATSSSSSVAIWDPATGRVATKLPGGGASSVRWSPDGRQLAAGRGTQGIHIWDASRGYTAN